MQRIYETLQGADAVDEAALDDYLLDPGPESAPGVRAIYKARTLRGQRTTISTEGITIHGHPR